MKFSKGADVDVSPTQLIMMIARCTISFDSFVIRCLPSGGFLISARTMSPAFVSGHPRFAARGCACGTFACETRKVGMVHAIPAWTTKREQLLRRA